LPTVLVALSWHLIGAANIADKAATINPELQIALEYEEEKTFRTNELIKKTLARI
jgi:hypothetical protein